jgi:hypothetical protein
MQDVWSSTKTAPLSRCREWSKTSDKTLSLYAKRVG